MVLDERDVRFECACSLERVELALRMQGMEALHEMIDEGMARGGAEVFCQFCRERYLVTTARLRELARES